MTTLPHVRGIDEILAGTDDDEEDDEDDDYYDSVSTKLPVDETLLSSFVSLSVDDDDDEKYLDIVRDYAYGHADKIMQATGKYQHVAAGAMLKTAETIVRTNPDSKHAFFLVVPSNKIAKQHIECLANAHKREAFVRSHMLQQAGIVETKALWDRPWKSLADASTEYKLPSEIACTLVRMRDKSNFALGETEKVYHLADVRKNIKVLYLAPLETRRLV